MAEHAAPSRHRGSETDSPLVSIILCTYNGRRFLAAQLESLLAQSHVRIEIIAVDDASSDGTRELLEAHAAADQRIVLTTRREQRGLIAGVEEGLYHARGEFVALADQDDVWERDKISVLLQEIGDAAAVYCASALIDEQDRPLGRTLLSALGHIVPAGGTNPWALFLHNSVSGHATLFRASLSPHLLPLDPALMHDHQIGIVATARGGLRYCDRALVRHRIHDQNHVNRLPESRLRSARDDKQRRRHKLRRLERRRATLLARAAYYSARAFDPGFGERQVKPLYRAEQRFEGKTFDLRLWWTLIRHRQRFFAGVDRPFHRAFQTAKGRRWYDRKARGPATSDPALGATRAEP